MEALHDILEELNITSLDESDIEAGLNEWAGDDSAAEANSASYGGAGLSHSLEMPGEDVSTETTTSAADVVSAALLDETGAMAQAGGGTVEELEAQLRLSIPPRQPTRQPTTARRPDEGEAVHAHLETTLAAVLDEQRLQSEELSELRREAAAAAAATTQMAPVRQQGGLPLPRARTEATGLPIGPGGTCFPLQMSDLTISDALYHMLRQKPDNELDVREWVQLRFHEARQSQRAEVERLRLEVEALREDQLKAQTRAERAERQLALREAAVGDLKGELERVRHGELREAGAKLRACECRLEEVKAKEQRFDEVAREAARLREEMSTLREAMATQSTAHQHLSKEHTEASEKWLHLEQERRLALKDVDAHSRRANLLEETLARRDEEVTELRSKVDSLREKKRELARKATAEQADKASELRDHVHAEIQRFKDEAAVELETVRTNLNALHEKEVRMLQERVTESTARVTELRRRLEDEEQAHQALQLSTARVRAELQNEITELTGTLKLRAFESERALLTTEEVSVSRQKLERENEQLHQQVDILKKECYSLEAQLREDRAIDRAELASLREQLKSYSTVERELDAAIRSCAEGVPTSAGDAAPQSMDEAVLLGTTLAGAPTSAQRRIQQSLILAQELQRRTREAAQAKSLLQAAEEENMRLREELEGARQEIHFSSEPQAYLLEALRRREGEVLGLRRELRSHEADLGRSQQQLESAMSIKVQVEEDLKKLLSQRQHLHGLQALLASKEEQFMPAEHRGRAPTQAAPRILVGGAVERSESFSSFGAQGVGPAWFQRLRARLDATDPRHEGGVASKSGEGHLQRPDRAGA